MISCRLANMYRISSRRCSNMNIAAKPSRVPVALSDTIQNTVSHHTFRVGAAVGFGFGLVLYYRERFISRRVLMKRSGDYIGLVDYWREKGRVTKAFRILEKAAKIDPKALILLGDAYTDGNGVTENPEKAYQCYMKAYEKGASPYSLATAMFEGRGCPKFPEKGFELLIKAAMQGDQKACTMLTKLYKGDSPLGLSRDRSLYYARLAAQRGCAESEQQFNRYCLDAGMVLLNRELDQIADQIGSAELNAVAEIVSKSQEERLSKASAFIEAQEQQESIENISEDNG